MANTTKPPGEKFYYLAGSVTYEDHAHVLLLAKEWNINRAQTVGRIIREWMEEHRKELPSLKRELEKEGQGTIEEMLINGDSDK